jgi:Spy/CpxP family protein refolding chaperone
MHGEHGKGPYSQLDLSREQREQIRKIMGEQMHERRKVVEKYLEKLSPPTRKP